LLSSKKQIACKILSGGVDSNVFFQAMSLAQSKNAQQSVVRPDKSHRTCVRRRCRLLTGREASPVLVKVRLPREASRPFGNAAGRLVVLKRCNRCA